MSSSKDLVQSSEVYSDYRGIKVVFKPETTLAEAKAWLAEEWPQPTYGWKLFGSSGVKVLATIWREESDDESDEEEEEDEEDFTCESCGGHDSEGPAKCSKCRKEMCYGCAGSVGSGFAHCMSCC